MHSERRQQEREPTKSPQNKSSTVTSSSTFYSVKQPENNSVTKKKTTKNAPLHKKKAKKSWCVRLWKLEREMIQKAPSASPVFQSGSKWFWCRIDQNNSLFLRRHRVSVVSKSAPSVYPSEIWAPRWTCEEKGDNSVTRGTIKCPEKSENTRLCPFPGSPK